MGNVKGTLFKRSAAFVRTVRLAHVYQCGQSTVEFAIIAGGFMVVVIGLASIWRASSSGMFVEHALMVASHHLGQVMPTSVADIFLY